MDREKVDQLVAIFSIPRDLAESLIAKHNGDAERAANAIIQGDVGQDTAAVNLLPLGTIPEETADIVRPAARHMDGAAGRSAGGGVSGPDDPTPPQVYPPPLQPAVYDPSSQGVPDPRQVTFDNEVEVVGGSGPARSDAITIIDDTPGTVAAATQEGSGSEAEQLERALQLSLLESAGGGPRGAGSSSGGSAALAAAPASSGDDDLSRAIANSYMDLTGADYTGGRGDPPSRVRDPGTPVGLDNVGNTCYFNAMLQVYFHLAPVRRAVLSWREPGAGSARANPGGDVVVAPGAAHDSTPTGTAAAPAMEEGVAPGGSVAATLKPVASASDTERAAAPVRFLRELQRLFARLLLSDSKSVSPEPVLRELRDDKGDAVTIGNQQDVSEFNWLFIERLDEGLRAGSEFRGDPSVPRAMSLVRQMFYGTTSQQLSYAGAGGGLSRNTTLEDIGQIIASIPDLDQVELTAASTAGTGGSGVGGVGGGSGRAVHVHEALSTFFHEEQVGGYKPDCDEEGDDIGGGDGDGGGGGGKGMMDVESSEPESRSSAGAAGAAAAAVKASRIVTLSRVPSVLTIQLQRVHYDPRTKSAYKVNTPVEIDDTLFVDRYLSDNAAEVGRIRESLRGAEAELAGKVSLLRALANGPRGLAVPDTLLAVAELLEGVSGDDGAADPEVQASLGASSAAVRDVVLGALAAPPGADEISRALRRAGDAAVEQRRDLESRVAELRERKRTAYDGLNARGYTLYAVLIHDGGARSGHYWGYIRAAPSEGGAPCWTSFNDARVTRASAEEMLRDAGSARSHCNAYCLLYVSTEILPTAEPGSADAGDPRGSRESPTAEAARMDVSPDGDGTARAAKLRKLSDGTDAIPHAPEDRTLASMPPMSDAVEVARRKQERGLLPPTLVQEVLAENANLRKEVDEWEAKKKARAMSQRVSVFMNRVRDALAQLKSFGAKTPSRTVSPILDGLGFFLKQIGLIDLAAYHTTWSMIEEELRDNPSLARSDAAAAAPTDRGEAIDVDAPAVEEADVHAEMALAREGRPSSIAFVDAVRARIAEDLQRGSPEVHGCVQLGAGQAAMFDSLAAWNHRTLHLTHSLVAALQGAVSRGAVVEALACGYGWLSMSKSCPDTDRGQRIFETLRDNVAETVLALLRVVIAAASEASAADDAAEDAAVAKLAMADSTSAPRLAAVLAVATLARIPSSKRGGAYEFLLLEADAWVERYAARLRGAAAGPGPGPDTEFLSHVASVRAADGTSGGFDHVLLGLIPAESNNEITPHDKATLADRFSVAVGAFDEKFGEAHAFLRMVEN